MSITYRCNQAITGVVAPMSPIVPGSMFSQTGDRIFSQIGLPAYEEYQYPWYKLYDENLAAISVTGCFDHLKSVHTLDSHRVAERCPVPTSLDPDAPPQCSSHLNSAAVCVFRPCSHDACTACLGMAMMSNCECPVCNCEISKFVGFKKPIAKVHADHRNAEGGWTVEQGIIGVRTAEETDDNVITLFLVEDRVGELHGSTYTGMSVLYIHNFMSVIQTNFIISDGF
jgi:hypothetical protein